MDLIKIFRDHHDKLKLEINNMSGKNVDTLVDVFIDWTKETILPQFNKTGKFRDVKIPELVKSSYQMFIGEINFDNETEKKKFELMLITYLSETIALYVATKNERFDSPIIRSIALFSSVLVILKKNYPYYRTAGIEYDVKEYFGKLGETFGSKYFYNFIPSVFSIKIINTLLKKYVLNSDNVVMRNKDTYEKNFLIISSFVNSMANLHDKFMSDLSITKLHENIILNENIFQVWINSVKKGQADIIAKYKKHINDLEKAAVEQGKIDKAKLKKFEQEIIALLKAKGATSPQKLKLASKSLGDAVVEFVKSTPVYEQYKERGEPGKKRVLSFTLLVLTVVMELGFAVVFGLFGGKFLAMLITAYIIGPIIEESVKVVAIRGGYGKTFLRLFVWTEFILFIIGTGFKYLGHPLKLAAFIAARLVGVALHYATAKGYMTADVISEKLPNNEKLEKMKKEIEDYALDSGIVFHMIFNMIIANILQAIIDAMP